MGITTTKASRGRPAIISKDLIARMQAHHPDVTTRRGLLNKYYELKSFKFLNNHPGIEYICNPGKNKARWGILREIGRLCGNDEEQTIKLAEAICERQAVVHFTVREWEKQLREIRISETVSDNINTTKQTTASR